MCYFLVVLNWIHFRIEDFSYSKVFITAGINLALNYYFADTIFEWVNFFFFKCKGNSYDSHQFWHWRECDKERKFLVQLRILNFLFFYSTLKMWMNFFSRLLYKIIEVDICIESISRIPITFYSLLISNRNQIVYLLTPKVNMGSPRCHILH